MGDGLFVTARHVAENEVRSVQTTQESRDTLRSVLGIERTETLSHPGRASRCTRTFFHPNEAVDIGVIEVEGLHAPAVPINDPDQEVGRRLLLDPLLVMGYPRVPQTIDPPALVVTTAEVNAAITMYDGSPGLVLSPMARGGFSGGLVLSEDGTALGVISRSLLKDEDQTELGFLSALRTPQILECFGAHDLTERLPSSLGSHLRIDDKR